MFCQFSIAPRFELLQKAFVVPHPLFEVLKLVTFVRGSGDVLDDVGDVDRFFRCIALDRLIHIVDSFDRALIVMGRMINDVAHNPSR